MKEPALLGPGYFSEPRDERCEMPINIEEIIEKAFEQTFVRALDRTIQSKAEALFKEAFENESPLAKKLEEKIDQGFQRFLEEGICWEKKGRI
jgi:hypothetical protein